MRHFCRRSFHNKHVLGLFVLLLLVKSPLPGYAQQEQDKQDQDRQQKTDKPGLSADVKVVHVLATIRDKKGAVVTNLGQDDFKLEEDGRPQTITYFARETDLPLTLGLLVDTSFNQRRVLPEGRGASQSFLDNILREGQDQAFLIHFDWEVELLQDLTSSHQKMEAALKQLTTAEPAQDSSTGNGGSGGGGGYPGGGGGGNPGGGGGYPGGRGGGGQYPRRVRRGTALYDAIFLASDEVIKKQKGRKALIILSDGVDRGSKETLEHTIETAQRADTIIYAILFENKEEEDYSSRGYGSPGGVYGGGGPYGGGGYPGGGGWGGRRGGGYPPQRMPEERPDGKKTMARISSETGGHMFEVSKKQTVDQIYRQIEEELRAQYMLGYTPEAGSALGYHKIHLTTKQKDYVVQSREGYYADR